MLEIQYKSIDDLKPYDKNSRTHSIDQINQIVTSIKRFGWTNPILLDNDNGIIAGHGRLEAAKVMGLSEVPTIKLSDLTDDQRRAYIIADNKLALNAGWDDEILKMELQDIPDAELSAIGFSPDELNLLFNGWDSNIEIPETNTDIGDNGTIKISVDKEQILFAKETITNALDEAGIEYSL